MTKLVNFVIFHRTYLFVANAPRAQAAAMRLGREILAPKPPPQRFTLTSTLWVKKTSTVTTKYKTHNVIYRYCNSHF